MTKEHERRLYSANFLTAKFRQNFGTAKTVPSDFSPNEFSAQKNPSSTTG